MPKINYSEKQINSLLKGIYVGAIDVFSLPKNLYKATHQVLNQGLETGYGDVDKQLLAEMKNNIYMFSAAKTFHQVLEMQSMLYENNEKLDYKTFRDRVRSTYDTYNESYLESEYITAVTSGSSAATYKEAVDDAELFTQLRYVAIIDQHTSPECKLLNGTIAPTKDKFWHLHTPPTHFRCRCELEKIDKYSEEKSDMPGKLDRLSKHLDEAVNPVFKNNSAISGKVFTKDHPYFSVPKRYQQLAKKNFGLEIPK